MNLDLLLSFAKQDFVDRYAGSALGALWAFIHPLVMIFIYTAVFASVMGARLPGVSSLYSYSLYLVAGLLPWMAFANTIMRCSGVFLDKRHIISKVPVSLSHLPLYLVASEVITFLIAFAIFMVFLALTGNMPGRLLLLLPFVFVVQQIFAFGIGLLFGIFNVFLRDTKELVGIFMTFWFWLTPIVWVPDIAPEFIRRLQAEFNPAYFFIDAYHSVFAYQRIPDFQALSNLVVIAHLVLLFAYLMLKWMEKDIRDFV